MHRRLTLLRKSSQPQRILPQHFPCKWSLNCGRFADSGRCGFPRLLILTLSSSCVHVPANPNPLLCVSTHTPSLSLVSLILLHSAGGSRSSCPRCRGYHLMPISAISCSASCSSTDDLDVDSHPRRFRFLQLGHSEVSQIWLHDSCHFPWKWGSFSAFRGQTQGANGLSLCLPLCVFACQVTCIVSTSCAVGASERVCSPVGVWVCLLGARAASRVDVGLWVQCERSRSADRPAASPESMLPHVGWYLLLGCLLLDLDGLHVQGQRRREGKVRPGETLAHTFPLSMCIFPLLLF